MITLKCLSLCDQHKVQFEDLLDHLHSSRSVPEHMHEECLPARLKRIGTKGNKKTQQPPPPPDDSGHQAVMMRMLIGGFDSCSSSSSQQEYVWQGGSSQVDGIQFIRNKINENMFKVESESQGFFLWTKTHQTPVHQGRTFVYGIWGLSWFILRKPFKFNQNRWQNFADWCGILYNILALGHRGQFVFGE